MYYIFTATRKQDQNLWTVQEMIGKGGKGSVRRGMDMRTLYDVKGSKLLKI